jgi:hypothetical protein
MTIHHNNGGEILPLVEYLVGRKSGRYQASHPSRYRGPSKETRIHIFRHATTVADYVGDTFPYRGLQQGRYQHDQQSSGQQDRYHRQQQEQSLSPSPAPDVLPYPTDRPFQSHSMNTTDDEETTTLSQETRLKIAELKKAGVQICSIL